VPANRKIRDCGVSENLVTGGHRFCRSSLGDVTAVCRDFVRSERLRVACAPGFAIEHAWLMDGVPDEDEGDDFGFELEPELQQLGAPLALLATDPDVPPEISSAAKEWLSTVTYGLWQISDPEPGPGMWLTDIVTGARRYAAIPPEQLPGMSRWSVLLGALVSLDGIWRTTGAVVLLRPFEGERRRARADPLAGRRGRADRGARRAAAFAARAT
jgi:hypothetical protein